MSGGFARGGVGDAKDVHGRIDLREEGWACGELKLELMAIELLRCRRELRQD